MKIIIIQGAFFPVPPVKGGAVEKRWFELAKEFVRQKNEVLYLSKEYSGMPTVENIEGVRFLRKSGFNFHSNFLISNLRDFIYSCKIVRLIPNDMDVIITNSFWSPILLNKINKDKTMVDVARMPKGQMYLYKGVRFLRANSTPVAEAIKNELKKKYNSKVITIPNPLTFKIENDKNVIAKEKLILYTGRIHPEKGIHILIKAFNRLKIKDWKLTIIGAYKISDGGGGEKYLEELKSIIKNDSIRFCDPIYDINALNEYYQRSSIFVYPSLSEKGETFGLSPLEAMAWGSVPIVSDLKCFKDFITNELNGLIFNHRAANSIELLSEIISKIIIDEQKRDEMSAKAIEVRESHSVEKIANEFLETFK